VNLRVLVVCCLVGGGGGLQAGGGPENVALVVNADSWASMALANHYVQWRRIPPSNVIYLEGLTSFEQTDIETFREKILVPVFKTLFERDLLGHIDYIVYSSDFPTAIDASKDLGGAKPAKHLSPTASITGLTYLYQLVLAKNPQYIELLNNLYARRPLRDVQIPPMTSEDRAAFQQANELASGGKWEEAVRALRALAQRLPGNVLLQYNLACSLARTGQGDAALRALEQAVAAGWSDGKHTRNDPDLESLRAAPAFEALLKKMDEKRRELVEVQPTSGFRSKYQWDGTGARVSENGVRYVLSTMLAVTSGRGNSVREALDYLQRSVAADATNPRGTIYFMENSDVRSTTRQWAFASTVKALEGTGVQGAIVNGSLPEKKDDVAGAMVGSAGVDWGKSGSTILPGAICEHLTSFGGIMLEGAGQTPLSEFLRYGAAGSSGTVVEPMALQAKFPCAFLHLHYARGSSLAEAFYQSLLGPYQLLVVGDALCQPWAKRLSIEVPGVQPGQRVSGQLVLEPRVSDAGNANAAADHFEVFIDGKRLVTERASQRFTVDTNAIGDGWHELRVVAIAAGLLETQSRVILPLIVDNRGGSLTLARENTAAREVPFGEPLVVRAKAPNAKSITILHNGRILGTIGGADGTLNVDTRTLGLGPVALQASTRLAAQTSFSAPLEITVLPPAALKPVTGVNAKKLVDGIQLTVGKDAPTIVTETKDADWLAKLNVGADQPLKMEAFFTVSADELYQFQFEGNSVSTISVDGEKIWPLTTSPDGPVGWTMVPVHLRQGTHRFTLTGTTARTPALRIRFGGPGCTSLDGKRFRHLE
jgi:tetratricopeptide (TPR) repeat protein